MRKRNRKIKKNDGFLFPVPFAGIFVVLVAVGLGYVGLGCRCQSLGQELKKLEVAREELNKAYQQELYKWTSLKAPPNLARELAKYGIKMTWPSSRQVVRLGEHEVLADPWDLDTGRRYARLDRSAGHE